ncbi:hypothetical protein SUGI_0673120 [Cryptomeria japonica]|nr:hypothetical protein SUGI_0673120 [Cryptomeria japonica]
MGQSSLHSQATLIMYVGKYGQIRVGKTINLLREHRRVGAFQGKNILVKKPVTYRRPLQGICWFLYSGNLIMENEIESKKFLGHAVVVLYHTNPLLQFTKNMASKGRLISFIMSLPYDHTRIEKAIEYLNHLNLVVLGLFQLEWIPMRSFLTCPSIGEGADAWEGPKFISKWLDSKPPLSVVYF